LLRRLDPRHGGGGTAAGELEAVSVVRIRNGVIVLLLAIASGAEAQTRPSFDCTKATSTIEKAICADKEAADADRARSEAYRRPAESLANPAARAHLLRDQTAWLSDRQRICPLHAAQSQTDRTLPTCLRDLATARAEHLSMLPAGNAYPFIGERRLVERGR